MLCEGGYETTFVDADLSLVERLNERRAYPLRLVSDMGSETLAIGPVSALFTGDEAAIVKAIAGADIVSIAVGASNLTRLGGMLAAGIQARGERGGGPLDILLCENQWHAATLMREILKPHFDEAAWAECVGQIGLVETVIGRMVPAPTEAIRAEDPLLVVAEPYKELPIAKTMLRGLPPTLPGLILADNFEAFEARKLYLHNMSHAALAYLGWRRGHEYIWQCAADEEVAGICRDALRETTAAISDQYGLPAQELDAYSADLMRRFTNKALGDTVARVAADPLRKLRPSDRLIGAAELCNRRGRSVEALGKIIAAALRYDNPTDPAAMTLQARREAEGDEAVLLSVCGIESDEELSYWVRGALIQMEE